MNAEDMAEGVTLDAAGLHALLERVRVLIAPEDFRILKAVCGAVLRVCQMLSQKDTTLGRLRRMLFGARTEKTRTVLSGGGAPAPKAPPTAKAPRKGHGRRSAAAHTAAPPIRVPHPSLQPGGLCPDCGLGRLYALVPKVILRFEAQPPITSSCFHLDRLRCARCGATHSAPPPPQAGTQKYAPEVGPMLALMRYGAGMPNYRMERLQDALGVPLPASTQWELMAQAAEPARPVLEALIVEAAGRELFHNDDTTMRVQEIRRAIRADPQATRTGIFTTCVMALSPSEHQPALALFFTANRHAGENLDRILDLRPEDLPLPLQMSDALSRNPPKTRPTRQANCLAHGRREVVDALPHFPEEGRHILLQLQVAYRIDAQARELRLGPQERLELHRQHTAPVFEALHLWMTEQLEQKRIEPNSAMGRAITYLQNHWEKLTLFLREPGAPVDNNICERALKQVVLHRKNSMGYKTRRGAEVGDLFMSLIHTCRLNRINPFAYLTALVRNAPAVQANPAGWLPWNYPQSPTAPDTG